MPQMRYMYKNNCKNRQVLCAHLTYPVVILYISSRLAFALIFLTVKQNNFCWWG